MEGQESLWCRVCQRGPGGLNSHGKYKSGDICPMCVNAGRQGTDIGTLTTTQEEIDRIAEIAEFNRKKKAENAIKGQKGVDEAVKEAEDRMRGEVQELRDQVRELTKVRTIQSVKEPEPVVEKPKAKLGDNVKAEFDWRRAKAEAEKAKEWVPANHGGK